MPSSPQRRARIHATPTGSPTSTTETCVDHEPSTDSEATYRLPRSVTPSRYDLTLEPSLDTATFDGHEAIAVTVHEPVTEIVLNAKELEVLDGSLESADGSSVDLEKVVLDAGSERVTLGLADTATPGEWNLRLRFRGTLNDRRVDRAVQRAGDRTDVPSRRPGQGPVRGHHDHVDLPRLRDRRPARRHRT